jgi:putative tryptophan/tyrosine transport system substrate-binding protein
MRSSACDTLVRLSVRYVLCWPAFPLGPRPSLHQLRCIQLRCRSLWSGLFRFVRRLPDPVGQGFVTSLSRPGGNITGFTFVDSPMIGKYSDMLKEIAPGIRRIALTFNPSTAPYYPLFLGELGAAAPLSVELLATPVHDEAEIEAAVTAFARQPGGGLIVAPEPFMNTHRALIVALAERHGLPAIYGFRPAVTEGALMSYGIDTIDLYRRGASYIDRILKGEKPADLPVQAPVKYELVINLKTARALGLTVPQTLLVIADEVIE